MKADELENALSELAREQPPVTDRRAAIRAHVRRRRQVASGLIGLAVVLVVTLVAQLASPDPGRTLGVADGSLEVAVVHELSSADGVHPTGPIRAIGGSLFALARVERTEGLNPPTASIVRASSPKGPWTPVALPAASEQATSNVPLQRLEQAGRDLVVASGSVGDRFYVWATSDGLSWTGGLVGNRPPVSFGGADIVHVVGDALVTYEATASSLTLLVSRDQAATWQRHPVDMPPGDTPHLVAAWSAPDGSLRALANVVTHTYLLLGPGSGPTWGVLQTCEPLWTPAAAANDCLELIEASPLLARGLDVSLDGGVTWQTANLEDAIGIGEAAAQFDAMGRSPAGTYLGIVRGFIPAGGGWVAWVLHSTDGLRWTAVLGMGSDGCMARPADTSQPFARASDPVLVGGHWIVSFSCPGRPGGVFAITATDGAVTELHALQLAEHGAQPVATASGALVAINGADPWYGPGEPPPPWIQRIVQIRAR